MKRIVTLILALVMLTALCACGGKAAAKTIDLDALGKEIADSGVFTDTMSQPGEGIAARVYGFDEAKVKTAVLYTGTGATAEEIFLAEGADKDTAAALKTACEDRIEHQKQAFQSYVPEELVKLDDAVLVTSGNYVILVVSGNSDTVKGIVEGYTGK